MPRARRGQIANKLPNVAAVCQGSGESVAAKHRTLGILISADLGDLPSLLVA